MHQETQPSPSSELISSSQLGDRHSLRVGVLVDVHCQDGGIFGEHGSRPATPSASGSVRPMVVNQPQMWNGPAVHYSLIGIAAGRRTEGSARAPISSDGAPTASSTWPDAARQ